jgi:hypothetical protein
MSREPLYELETDFQGLARLAAVREMRATEQPITKGQFRRRIGSEQWRDLQLWISNDARVDYYQSFYKGKPAVIARSGGSEHIFVKSQP